MAARKAQKGAAEEQARHVAAEAARVEAGAIRRDAEFAINGHMSDIAQLEQEMEELRRRRPPKELPEHVVVARADARRTMAALIEGEEAFCLARDALRALPPAPKPGLLSRLLGYLPSRRRMAAARAAAERALQSAEEIRDQKQEDHDEADRHRANVDRDWERATDVLTRHALKQRAERLGELRALVNLLRWRPAYIRRTPEEVADAIRRRPWEDDSDDGESGAAPAAVPQPPARP